MKYPLWCTHELRKFHRHPAQGSNLEMVALMSPKHAESRVAEMHRLFEHRVEHRRQIAWRRVDDLQYLGSRGLLLQCLASLGKEPRVLHRDHCLGGKVF